MSDLPIVERLRGKEITHSNTPYAEIARVAADAIEILVAALEPLACHCKPDYRECAYSECLEGAARAALEKVRAMK